MSTTSRAVAIRDRVRNIGATLTPAVDDEVLPMRTLGPPAAWSGPSDTVYLLGLLGLPLIGPEPEVHDA